MATKNANQGNTLDWSNVATWAEGAVPASTNDVVIGEGFFAFTAGFAQGAVNLASLYVSPLADCRIGSASLGPLVIAVNNSGAGVLWAARSGECRLSGNTNILVQDSASAPVVLSGGSHALLIANRGHLVVQSGADFVELYIAPGASAEVAEHASDRINTLRCGGTLVSRRSVEQGVLTRGANVRLIEGATNTDGSGTGRLIAHDGALCSIEAKAALTADRLSALGGIFDLRRSTAVVTITNSEVTSQGQILSQYPKGPAVFTNATKQYGQPGSSTPAVSFE